MGDSLIRKDHCDTFGSIQDKSQSDEINMSPKYPLTGRQIAAGRTIIGMSQAELASAANISTATLKRMEGSGGAASGYANNVAAVRGALEQAGVVFLEPGMSADGGAGVRLARD